MNIYKYILVSNKSKWILKTIFLSAIFAISMMFSGVVTSQTVQDGMRDRLNKSIAVQQMPKEQLMEAVQNMAHVDYIFTVIFIILLFVLVSEVASSTLRNRNFNLLPENRDKKFFAAVGMAGACFILISLLSVPIEAVGHLFHGGSRFNQIEIGGFLSRICENPDMILFSVVGFCASLFLRTIVRNQIIYRVLIFACAYFMMGLVVDVHLAGKEYSAIVCYVSYILPVVLLVASWQIYRRWQIANSGFFMI